MEDFGLFPGDSRVFIDLFWTEELCPIITRAWTVVWKTAAQVFASPRDQDGAIQRLAECRFVAARAVAHGNEAFVQQTRVSQRIGAVGLACPQRPGRG
jgi:hypothetical protein